MSHNSMSKLQPHFFSNMNRLLWLNISHNDVSEIHGRIFARNSLLRVLHMNNNKLTRYFFFSNNLYKCLVHFIFRILVKVTKNEKNQLSCLFIFCVKNPHFASKLTADFFVFWFVFWSKRKTKNGMNPTKNSE